MRNHFVVILFFFTFEIQAQEIYATRIRGLRVEGSVMAKFPLATLSAQSVTISFDTDTPQPEFFRIKVLHCDRNWKETFSTFINDPDRIIPLAQIPYTEAPPGVKHYRWTYTFQLPGFPGFEHFRYSGNYRVEIWNRALTELVAAFKMLVTEEHNNDAIDAESTNLPSESFPWNQAHRVSLLYVLPSPDERHIRSIDQNFIRAADVYVNRKIEYPRRIDFDDSDRFTSVLGWGTSRIIFRVDNILPGNEYRVFDFRDVNIYRQGAILRNISGTDVRTMFELRAEDEDGISTYLINSPFADYEHVRFELLMNQIKNSEIYVVGDFNGWRTNTHWKMTYDTLTDRYVLHSFLRRGRYEYQYVLNDDWYFIEGNDIRTENVYTAVLYYRSQTLNGYDRIILAAQRKGVRKFKESER